MNFDRTRVPSIDTISEIQSLTSENGSLTYRESPGIIVIEYLYPASAVRVNSIEIPYPVNPKKNMGKEKLAKYQAQMRMGAWRRGYWALKGICRVIDDNITITSGQVYGTNAFVPQQ